MMDLSTAFLGLILLFFALIFYYFLGCDKNPRHVKFAKQFPGPTSFPFIGNSWDFRGSGQGLFVKLLEYIEKYQSTPFRLWLGSHLFIVVSDSEDLQMVFSSSKLLGRPKLFEMFGHSIGYSIFNENDLSVWKKDRKMIQTQFVPKVFHSYVPNIIKNVRHCAEKLSKHLDGEEFELKNYFQPTTFDIITQSLLDTTFDLEDTNGERYGKAIARCLDVSFLHMVQSWMRLKPLEWISKMECSFLKSIIFGVVKQICDEKMPVMENEARERKMLTAEGREEEISPKTMLNILYEIGEEGKDMKRLKDEMNVLILGGSSTTASSLEFLFLVFGIYQDIQERIYEEIYEVFGDSDREADEHDMKKLTYLDQVVKETLRRFTLVPMTFRVVENDCKIGKHRYPQGTGLILFPLGAHFNPKYYPDPFKFNPDNFSSTAIENRPKYAFIPFSAGARNCIGSAFGLLQMKLIACELLRKYKFNCNMKFDDIVLQTRYVLSTTNECKVSIKRRNVEKNSLIK